MSIDSGAKKDSDERGKMPISRKYNSKKNTHSKRTFSQQYAVSHKKNLRNNHKKNIENTNISEDGDMRQPTTTINGANATTFVEGQRCASERRK